MIVTDYILPTTKKRIKYYRQLGNFLDRHRTVKLYDIRANYFDIQRKCMSEGMSVFLPSNQAEIDEVVGIIPSILKREFDDNGNEKLTEDIYSGLYIRMSDMDKEGCWKTTGTNGVLRPFSQMEDQYGKNCPIQHFPHINNNMVLDDGYDNQSGEDFMMLARTDKKFYDVSHMMTILDTGIQIMDAFTNSDDGYFDDFLDDEYATPGSRAFHGILGVCEYPTDDDGIEIVPCDEGNASYAMDFCVGHQKDIKYIHTGTYSYDDAEAQCSNLGDEWKLWYPESKEEETDTLAAIKEAGHNDLTYWVRDAGSFECRYNPKMVDPKGGVSATHYTTSGDYTLKDGLSGTHNVICEKVLDQYKDEREICDEYERNSYVFYTWPFYTNMIEIENNDGYQRELEYVGKTTYKRAHAICQAKGKQLFLPRDRNEIQDVYNIFYKTTLPDGKSTVLGEPKLSYKYFENKRYTELNYRPSAWIRYTDQDDEHCWLSDDQCNGGMKWTQWAYQWMFRPTVGYYPKGSIHMDFTGWTHQPDNWGLTKDKLFAYARRFNEYGQQYAAIEGVSKVYESRKVGYPEHGHEEFYAQMHDTFNTYPYAFAFCEDK